MPTVHTLINHDAPSGLATIARRLLGVDSHAGVREATEYLIQQGTEISCLLVVLRTICVIRDTLGDESPWFTAVEY